MQKDLFGNNKLNTQRKQELDPFRAGQLLYSGLTTPEQQEILIHMQIDPQASLCYNECVALELTGDLNLNSLKKSFELLCERHESLRMTFSPNGKYFFINKEIKANINIINAEENFELILENRKSEQVQTLFDLESGPCFRVDIIKKSESQAVVLFCLHHIICDGWSMSFLINDLCYYYEQTCFGQVYGGQLSEVTPFHEFAISQQNNVINRSKALNFWTKEISNIKNIKTSLAEHNDKSVIDKVFRTLQSDRFDWKLSLKQSRLLKQKAKENKVSLYALSMSLFQISLFDQLHANKDEQFNSLIGVAVAPQASGVNVVGHLTRLLPFYQSFNKSINLESLTDQIRHKLFDVIDHQDISYGQLLQSTKTISRSPGLNPLFSIVFNIDQHAPGQGLFFSKLQGKLSTVKRFYENFEMFINMVSSDDEISFEIQYNLDLFNVSQVKNFKDKFDSILDRYIQNENNNSSIIIRDLLVIDSVSRSVEVKNKTSIELNEKSKNEDISNSNIIEINENIYQQIAQLWANILNQDIYCHIKDKNSELLNDHFFQVGGHSLLAIDLSQKIQETWAIEFSVKDVFLYPTIRQLSIRLQELLAHKSVNNIPKASLSVIDDKLEISNGLSINQSQIYYLEKIHPGTKVHHLPAAFRVKTHIRQDVLENALNFIIQNQDSLRTAFVVENGLPVRKVFDHVDLKVDRYSINEELLTTSLQNASLLDFDLSAPPLFKIHIYDIGVNDCVLFILAHHAIWDGWSFDIFFDHLDKTYAHFNKALEPSDEFKPIKQYSEFINYQEKYFLSEQYKTDKMFWQDQLGSSLPVLEFPADVVRSEVDDSSCDSISLNISLDLQNKARQFAIDNKTSLYNVFLTTYKIALARYSSQTDVIVGSAVRGRPHQDFAKTIGYFVNILPLRTQIDFNSNFLSSLKSVHSVCLQAYEHQYYPMQNMLMDINKSLKQENKNQISNLFQTFFSYQDVQNRRGYFAGKAYSQINVDRAETYTDIDMWMRVSEFKIEGGFEYRKSLFTSITMQRFSEYFCFLLDQVISEPSVPLFKADMPSQHLQLLENDWCLGKKDPENFKSFISYFKDIANSLPNKTAVISADNSMSYERLDAQSDRLAIYLQKRGIGKGDLIGICLNRTNNLLVTLLAVLKVGAGFVPMDPFFPKERLKLMLENSSTQLIITEDSFKDYFTTTDCEIFDIYEFLKLSIGPVNLIKNQIDPEQTAYVIYTSGSTGTPKGVEISHLSLCNFMKAMLDAKIMTAKDRLLAVTTFSFDISLLELLLPLFSGGTVCLVSREQSMDGNEIISLLKKYEITVMQATPTTWRLMIAAGFLGDKNLRVLCGGESFPKDLAQKLLSICGEVWNMYGPTETTIWSTCAKLQKNKMITVGRPILETGVHILDKNRQPVPIGAVGEVYLSGRGVSHGYFLRPDLNKTKFINLKNNLKAFATGDLGRWTCDGELLILGRSDRQIKMRGYRIELSEIEYHLRSLSTVQDVYVFSIKNKQQEIEIAAAVVLKSGFTMDDRSLRIKLSQTLPAYMVPSNFLCVNEIPLTPNGKIDENKLKNDFLTKPQPAVLAKELKLNVFDNASVLRSIWQRILKVDQISDEDNFFDLGGYSLLAVQLATMIEDQLHVQVPLASLIKAKNFAEFCRIVDSEMSLLVQKKQAAIKKEFHFLSLIEISNLGTQTPLLCFHGVGGNVLNYVQLVPALNNQRPLIAFQCRALDGVHSVRKTIEEMASDYITELKQVQPSGPYILAGGSMGGMLAFEVAQQLIKSGNEVQKLIMFDTFGPDINLKKYRTTNEKSLLVRIVSSVRSRVVSAFRLLSIRWYEMFGLKLPTSLLLKKVQKENYQALLRYRPSSYPGDLYLIRSKRKDEGIYSDLFMGWRSCIEGRIFVREIDSSHEHFIESPYLLTELNRILHNSK